MSTLSIRFPLDTDGFLRRQCSQCERYFKWHNGPTEGAPSEAGPAEAYYCPYCGKSAAPDQWFTEEQVAQIEAVASLEVRRQVGSVLERAAGSISSSGIVSMKAELSPQNPPPPLVEEDDMVAVESPCHPYEPVKVDESWAAPLHCLVCGAGYVVDLE